MDQKGKRRNTIRMGNIFTNSLQNNNINRIKIKCCEIVILKLLNFVWSQISYKC